MRCGRASLLYWGGWVCYKHTGWSDSTQWGETVALALIQKVQRTDFQREKKRTDLIEDSKNIQVLILDRLEEL